MKAISSVIVASLLALRCYAAAPAPIDGIAGLPLGSGTAEMMSLMDQRGAHINHGRSTSSHFYFVDGSFENQSVAVWHFHFFDSKLYRTEVALHPGDDKLNAYNEMKKALVEKYGATVQETKVKMDDADLIQLVNQGKLELNSTWIDSSSGHSLSCTLALNPAHYVLLRLTYKDDKTDTQLSEQEKSDL